MRETEYDKLAPMFLERWSPRAFHSDAITEQDLYTLLEAARWSPSCFNEQPWRFAVANSEQRLRQFQSVLVEGNSWAKAAPVLLIAFSKVAFTQNSKTNRWADFDTGAACMALALQANQLGLHCHAMGGFDQEMAYQVTGVNPNDYRAMCVIAVGKKADAKTLPEALRDRELPSNRKSLIELLLL